MTRAVRWGAGAVALLVVALAAGLAWQVRALHHDHTTDQRRAAALATAEAQVLDLTTLDTATVQQKLKALSERTEGQFQQQLQGITSAFVQVVGQNKVSATGHVDSAAVSSFEPDSATVLVASSAEVANKRQPQPVDRTYRMRVQLHWVSGRWLIDGMEFVS